MSFLPLVRLWILISVLATTAGWVLSALGCLNRPGYAVFLALGGIVLWRTRRAWGWDCDRRPVQWAKVKWRFSRALPLAFVVLAVLIFLGGALYAPTNHTAVTYRVPRTLHWLAHDGWFWIHTPNYRMNNRACGIEWLSAPLLLFTRSDRALFLLNFIPFLLLPGLVYSLFTQWNIRPRVAWQWMWLLPTGYCFILQAGSTGNDTFPTVYALAALDLACRARSSGRASDFWLSALSAALLTGAKASNLTLLLPWAIVVWWAFPRVRIRPLVAVGVLALSALVSFLPTAVLNVIYCGDWSGLNLERTGMDMKNPVVGIWGNVLILLLDNFVPPFFPLASWWNQHALTIVPQFIVGPMTRNFEAGFHLLWELPTEDWIGLGFGMSVLIAVTVLAGLGRGGWRVDRRPGGDLPRTWERAMTWSPWISLLAYCVKSGMVTGARLIAPYYPLLLPGLLAGKGQTSIVRTRWWQALAKAVAWLAIPVLVVTPGRPLWPAQTVLGKLQAAYPNQRLVARALKVYSVYDTRSDPLAQVRALLPAGITVVGFLGTEDDPDLSLWRPIGRRRVEHILLTDSGDDIRRRGIECAVVGGFNLAYHHRELKEWLEQTRAEVIATTNATIKVTEGQQPWYVVRFK